MAGLITIAGYSQSLETAKVVIINDSIIQMGQTNGRSQLLIPAPAAGRSIIVQSIDIRNKVNERLYSPSESGVKYKIGYQQGSYWYEVAEVDFDELNATGNTTYFKNLELISRLYEETQTNAAPLMIRFERPLNFTSGSNRLTLYITYRVLN